MELFAGIGSLLGFGGSSAAGTAAGAAAGTASGAASGISTAATIGNILEGGATVLGLVSSVAAGRAEQEAAEMAATDAEREQPLEILQGIERKRSLKAAAAEAVGSANVAHAASGVDLSFGSARQARQEAFRELDLGLSTNEGTTATRLQRLQERASSYRRMGKRALRAGIVGGVARGIGGIGRIASRY